MDNTLYYGDNLDVMRRHIGDETVDLIYLDPPFNSNANYNILFTDKGGAKSEAQGHAFKDTWRWGPEAAECYQQVVEAGGEPADAMVAFRKLLRDCAMMAYLAIMAPRLCEIRRVLKPTGSVYLHCDPTASHYLKVLMDTVFGPGNFRNEIAWCYRERERVLPHWNRKHDILLYYVRDDRASSTFNWETAAEPFSPVTAAKFRYTDAKGDYQIRGRNIKGSPVRAADGLRTEHEEQYPGLTYRDYLQDRPGVPPRDWWQIGILNKSSNERLGYPTQKPEALLERIILTSSNEGDLVLDPFCGCGTTVAVAERLGRRWIGIDIAHAAMALMKFRLERAFVGNAKYEVIGEPTTVADAQELADSDPYQFQWWALGKVGAEPRERRKGADKGVDGRAYFHVGEQAREIIFSVKAGGITAAHVRDLAHVVDREDAQIGVLITMRPPTQPMVAAAASAGWYVEELTGERYPRIQFLTVADLIARKLIDRPYAGQPTSTYRAAPRAQSRKPKQYPLGSEGE